MKLFNWIDTTSTEKQTCEHQWTAFAKPVTLELLDVFMCMECGKRVKVENGYCKNGELFIRVGDFDCYELASIWQKNQLSKAKIKSSSIYLLNATYYHIEKCWGQTTAVAFRNEMNRVLGFKID